MNRTTVIIAVIVALIAGGIVIGYKPEAPVEQETPGTPEPQPEEPEEPTADPTEEPEAPPEEPDTPPPVEEPTYEVIDLYTIIVDTDGPPRTEARVTILNLLDEPQAISLPVTFDGQTKQETVQLTGNLTLHTEVIPIRPRGTYNLSIGQLWRTVETSVPEIRFSPDTYDLTQGVPQFISTDFTDLDHVTAISKFRSGYGHDYSDSTEECRNMKHYYEPKPEYLDNGLVDAYSPVDGRVLRVQRGQRQDYPEVDYTIAIQSDDYPAFHVIIFHIDKHENITVGAKVKAGDHLGTFQLYYPSHDEYSHDYDIAVGVNTGEGYRFVSYFQTMTPELFQTYRDRGIEDVSEFIITKEDRDANPLTCGEEEFTGPTSTDDWTHLN